MAVLTTVLWSGSYILNKLAFQGGVGPLTLAGIRYTLAAALLLALGRAGRRRARQTPRLAFGTVLLLGLLGYAVAQGLQYMGQSYLTPTQSSLFLSVGNTLMVMVADMLWLRENQSPLDFVKLLLLAGGITLYYAPQGGAGFSAVGLAFMAASSVGYAVHMTLNRNLLRGGQADARQLVGGPMLAGGLLLLAAGLLLEGLPRLSVTLLMILLYLSGISGALGFTLWTASQKALTAFESSGINNLMLIEIALMDALFFGRVFSPVQMAAIAVVFTSIVWIQTGRRRSAPQTHTPIASPPSDANDPNPNDKTEGTNV
jgi:drug/metabolite transporter (DMT)-like permease